MLKQITSLTGCLFALCVLAGCGGGPEVVVPQAVMLSVVGTPCMNSNPNQEECDPNAAEVRIYELTGEINFLAATLESFWRDDEAAIGQELIRGSKKQFMIQPEDGESVTIDPNQEAQYIGVAANLRFPDPENWRKVYPVEELRGKEVVIQVNEDRVALIIQ